MEKELREKFEEILVHQTCGAYPYLVDKLESDDVHTAMQSAYQLGIQKERKEWQDAFKSLEKFANEQCNNLNQKHERD